MFTFILALHIIVAIAMIGLILIQHGKGADAGASFGAVGAFPGAAGVGCGALLVVLVLVVLLGFFCFSWGSSWCC